MKPDERLFFTHIREAWATFTITAAPMLDNLLDFLAWGERQPKREPTIQEGVKRVIMEYGEALRNLENRNYCLCCGQLAQQYGSGWASTDGSGSCSREVCVSCLEGGHIGCHGNKLACKPMEIHENCEHVK